MRYQFSLKSIFIATTLVAGAFGCGRISDTLFVLYIAGVLIGLDVYFRFKYGANYWRVSIPKIDESSITFNALEALVTFAFYGGLAGFFGCFVLPNSWFSGTLAIGGAICGASLGIAFWCLIFVDRKRDKDK
jgi:hypothetical protein